MKKYSIVFVVFIINICFLNAQNSYKLLITKGESSLKKNTANYQNALAIYEDAFQKFPDSIQPYQIYRASIFASKINDKNKAFKYLTQLSELEKDEEGYPGWDYVIGDYAQEDYANLLTDKRFKKLEEKARLNQHIFFEKLKTQEQEFFATSKIKWKHKKGKKLYQELKHKTSYLAKKQQNYSIQFKINDSTKTSYLVHLPKKYNPKKSYPVLVFLHGAVRYNQLNKFQTPESLLGDWNRFYTKYADKNEVILVFLQGSKKYNWMTSDDGFFMIPEMIKQIKKSIHINDNKIFISGHSNGATGSFSYLMKQPTLFAGMYGFNTHPKVYTGGTFIENIKNRSFINFSTDQDYYYPPDANDRLNKLMDSINADYKDYRYNGFPHWFPKFDESEPAYKILFSDINKRERNSFPKEINWEFDDNNYGSVDWLNDVKLDTLQQKKEWHKNLNFKIKKWYGYNKQDSLISKKVNINAFDFPRKSGKIIAQYNDNIFKVKTSCIKSFKIYISPEMVNLKRKIKVYVNGKLYYDKKLKINRDFMLKNFNRNHDRTQIWVNYIQIK